MQLNDWMAGLSGVEQGIGQEYARAVSVIVVAVARNAAKSHFFGFRAVDDRKAACA